MKLRSSFVANSSTSSFLILVPKRENAVITFNKDGTDPNPINLNSLYNLDNIDDKYLRLNWTPIKESNILTETNRYVRIAYGKYNFDSPINELKGQIKKEYEYEIEIQKFILDIVKRTLFFYPYIMDLSNLWDLISDLEHISYNEDLVGNINSILQESFDIAFHEAFERYYNIIFKYRDLESTYYIKDFFRNNIYRSSIKREILKSYYFNFKPDVQKFITMIGIYSFMYKFRYKLQKLLIPYGGDGPTEMDTFIHSIMIHENEYPVNIKNFYRLRMNDNVYD